MAFSSYAKQTPQAGKTVAYTMRGLRNPDGSRPLLHVEHVGESNRPFWLEALARASARARAGASTPLDIDRAQREDREERREILARHSVRNVENVFHDDGCIATAADIPEILRSIPDHDIDELWTFVQNHNNFRSYSITESAEPLAEK
jgi:hypothetical protein